MFKKLKRKFILTNVLTSAAVLIIAFSAIYVIAVTSAQGRAPKNLASRHPEGFSLEAQEDKNLAKNQNSTEKQPEPNANFQDFQDSDFNQYLEEQLHAEREASLKSLLISLIITGIAVEGAITLISFYLAEQSIKPVRDAYLAQKDFVANASHEIKTPLAVIQANLEAADIKNNKWIDNASKKAEDLANLNNQLLALARSETITEDIKLSEFSPKELISEIKDAFEATAKEQKKIININESPNINNIIKLNREAFEQIINIYIDNAIKYSKKNINININKNSINISSDGILIDEKKLPHLFERFYQQDKSAKGVGLGLAIAKSIAEKNNWKVYAKVDKKAKLNIFVLEFK